jgi:hypothetical protein
MGERRGTCSTKHALLARLAAEQEIPIALMLGIYQMNARNTPGVETVLARYGLASIPEAHCYLEYAGERIDVTRNLSGAEPIGPMMYEETIAPERIGSYKIAFHRRHLREFAQRAGTRLNLDFEALWIIREECIAALGE